MRDRQTHRHTDRQTERVWREEAISSVSFRHVLKHRQVSIRWIFKNALYKKKKLFTNVESHASAVSLLESGE